MPWVDDTSTSSLRASAGPMRATSVNSRPSGPRLGFSWLSISCAPAAATAARNFSRASA
jgi:hypothetical protein